MGIANYHDARCVIGMNRIRAAYMELAPDLERYFVMGTTDDNRGVQLTMGVRPQTPMIVQMLASTPMLVTVLDAILFAAIVAILALQLQISTLPSVGLGAIAFVAAMGAFVWYAGRDIAKAMSEHQPRFPRATSLDEA
jgi:hypothetical protein